MERRQLAHFIVDPHVVLGMLFPGPGVMLTSRPTSGDTQSEGGLKVITMIERKKEALNPPPQTCLHYPLMSSMTSS